MTYFLAVLVFPLLVGVLSLGVGLLVERSSGWRVPALLLPVVGFAGIVGLTQLVTFVGPLAPATPFVVVAAALAGAGVGRRSAVERWRARRAGWWWGFAGGAGAYLIANGPVVAAGRATFPGYLLDTTGSVQLMGADRIVRDGHSWAPPGTGGYGLQLDGYFGHGYPSGSHSALGALGTLVPVDLIWLYAPFLACAVALAALALVWIARRVGLAPWAAAAAGCVASVPALTYAYVLQGSIKEVVVLPLLMALGALILLAREQYDAGPRGAVPLAAVVAGGWSVIGLAFTPWAAAAAAVILVAGVRSAREGAAQRAWGTLTRAAAFVAALAVLALPTVGELGTAVSQARGVTNENAAAVSDPGNLLRPLLDVQAFGVWLGASHRVDPVESFRETYLLIGVVAVAVALGLVWLARTRRWAALAWVATSVLVWLVLSERATAWTAAKLLVLLSPVVLLVAFAGALGRLGSRRVDGVLLAGAVAVGVLLSNATLYHSTGLAPTGRFDELRQINDRFGGRAVSATDRVTLAPDFDEYALYLLRDMAPDSPGNARKAVPWTLGDGQGIGYGMTVDVESLARDGVARADTIVVRRSPFKSRPPAAFSRAFHGDHYDVWQRDSEEASPSMQALPLATPLQPVATPRCRTLGRFAARAAEAGASRLVAAPRAPNVAIDLASAQLRGGVGADTSVEPASLAFSGPATVTAHVEVPAAGMYTLWAEGNTGRALLARVDGREIGSVRNNSGGSGNAFALGDVRLTAGRHMIELVRGGGSLRPGDADGTLIRKLALAPAGTDEGSLRTVPVMRWRSLCGESLDWVEAT